MMRRLREVAVAVAVLQFGSACYGYAPVTTAPTVGMRVALDVTDEGRVALRQQLGPGVMRLEGRVAAIDGDELVLDASRVTQLRGLPLPLDSMRLRLNQRYVERVDERRLSRSRTMMAIGGAVSFVAAFIVTKGFTGRGTPPEQPPPLPPVDESRVPPW